MRFLRFHNAQKSSSLSISPLSIENMKGISLKNAFYHIENMNKFRFMRTFKKTLWAREKTVWGILWLQTTSSIVSSSWSTDVFYGAASHPFLISPNKNYAENVKKKNHKSKSTFLWFLASSFGCFLIILLESTIIHISFFVNGKKDKTKLFPKFPPWLFKHISFSKHACAIFALNIAHVPRSRLSQYIWYIVNVWHHKK